MIAAVVLAAGLSARMGRPKQTLPVKGVPMLQRVLVNLRKTKVDRVVVVLGADEREVRKRVKFVGETVVVNRAYAEGMSGSIRRGLEEVEGEADAVLVVLGDQPFVSPSTIDALIEAYGRTTAKVVVPVCRGRRGNPVVFDRSLFREVKGVRGDVGARSVVERNRDGVVEVRVEDDGVLTDIDTPSDYGYEKGAFRSQKRLGGA